MSGFHANVGAVMDGGAALLAYLPACSDPAAEVSFGAALAAVAELLLVPPPLACADEAAARVLWLADALEPTDLDWRESQGSQGFGRATCCVLRDAANVLLGIANFDREALAAQLRGRAFTYCGRFL